MSTEFVEHQGSEAERMYQINQVYIDTDEIYLPTRFGALVVYGKDALIVSTYGQDEPSILNVGNTKIRKVTTGGVYYCGVMSVKAEKYELMVHAPSPAQLESIVKFLMSKVEKADTPHGAANLYLNRPKCEDTHPEFIYGENSYKKVFDRICNTYNLLNSRAHPIDETCEITLR